MRKWIFFVKIWLWSICIINFGVLQAQNTMLSGRVTDARTQEPLPFVNITVNDGQFGTTSDIDGKFILNVKVAIKNMVFSYIGYESFSYQVNTPDDLKPLLKPLRIKLFEQSQNLREVVIKAGANPAHRIINLTVKNRNKNNPEKINSFKYKSYHKFHVNVEDMPLRKDSVIARTIDSLDLELLNYLSKRHLFLSESISERQYIAPNYNKETVLANKVSGFKNPSYAILAIEFQPFTFYKDYIELFGKQYLNPISKGSTEKYFFAMEDTVLIEKDTVYMISYTPLPDKNFEGLEGILYINTNKYAIQNIIASSPAKSDKMIGFRIEQKYDFLEDRFWFPSQLHTEVVFEKLKLDNRRYIGVAKSYLQDIELFPALRKRDFDEVTKIIHPLANKQNEDFWQSHRIEPLVPQEINTFSYLDSLGSRAKLDRFVRASESFVFGRIPLKGFIDWDFQSLLNYNRYEGLRITASFFTNEKLNERYQIGAYLAYGTKDKAFKAGGSFAYQIHKKFDLKTGLTINTDVLEPGNLRLLEDYPIFSGISTRQFLTQRMDKVQNIAPHIFLRPFRNAQFRLIFRKTWLQSNYDYQYLTLGEDGSSVLGSTNKFNFSELNFQFFYSLGQEYLQIGSRKIFFKSKPPTISLTYTKGLEILGGQFEYNKLETKIEYDFSLRHLGKTSLKFQAGLVNGDVPYALLYNGLGTTRNFPLWAKSHFQVMELYEFTADRFFSLMFQHEFPNILDKMKSQIFAPRLVLLTGFSYGSLKNKNVHEGISIKSMEKGYYESGLIIKDILRFNYANVVKVGLVGGIFYRYGAYRNEKLKENVAYRLGLGFTF